MAVVREPAPALDITAYTAEPPIKDTPREGPPPYKGNSSRSHSIMFLISEKRTTSKIRTEAVSPKCPLFEGSTVRP